MTNNIRLDKRPRKYFKPNCTRENWVEKVNEKLDMLLDEDMSYNALQEQWGINADMFPIDQRRDPPYKANTIIDSFDCYLKLGFIPPPEILLALKEAFDTYFNGKGELSLEEVLFGKVKKGVGNYAARRTDEIGSGLYGFFILFHQSEAKEMNQAEAAEAYLERERKLHEGFGMKFEMDVESFLRGLRRWKKSQAMLWREADKK